jgi:DnaJ homolog subfamily A member 2
MSDNLYEILGVDENVDNTTLKKAYRKLSMKTHPDVRGGDEERFKQIAGAYEVLSDRRKRDEYDMKRNNPMFSGHGMQFPPEIFDILSGLGGMGGMGGMGSAEGLFGAQGPHIFHVSGNMGMPQMGNPFGHMQANRRSRETSIGEKPRVNKPVPIEKPLEISLEEAFLGKTKQISINRTIISGMSRSIEKETLYISIPKGVDTDEIITIEDKGNIHNEISGDVKIIIKIKNYTKFERKGLDLIYNKEISLKEALCGFSFDMEYIDGKVFKINNNEGNIISDGYEKNIPNMGMNRDNNIGILTINFKVIYPKKLSLEDIQKIKEIL